MGQFSHLKVNTYNLLLVIFVGLGTVSTAYGLAIIGSTVGQPNFYTYFNLAPAGEPGTSSASRPTTLTDTSATQAMRTQRA